MLLLLLLFEIMAVQSHNFKNLCVELSALSRDTMAATPQTRVVHVFAVWKGKINSHAILKSSLHSVIRASQPVRRVIRYYRANETLQVQNKNAKLRTK